MKKYKILLAEDTIEARDVVINELNKLKHLEYRIDECEFPDKALSRLADSERSREYYDILFVDLDFTQQAHKGGKRDSGFQIIKRAFDICPISKICTYSGQFRQPDLSDEHQELVKRGLLVYTFDKSKRDAGLGDWFTKGMSEVLAELKDEEFLFDIFDNHKSIKEKVSVANMSFQAKWEINSNLDTIIILLQSLSKISSKYIFYRLIIHLYHSSLILLLTDSKDESKIKSNFEKNKSAAENKIQPKKPFEWREDNALSQFIAESPIDSILFGFKLNDYRNKSIHPEDTFNADILIVIFANLVLSLNSLTEKNKIKVKRFEELLHSKKELEKGRKDLEKLIEFIIRDEK